MLYRGARMQRVIDAYAARLVANADRSCDRVLASGIAFYRTLPDAVARGSIRRAFEATGADLGSDVPTVFPGMMRALGEQRSALGIAVAEMLAGMRHGFDVVSEDFAEFFADDPEARIFWENQRARIAYAGAAALADAYAAARERIVRAQADEILRLGAQVLRVHRGVLLVPLLGELSPERMQRASAALLAAVDAQRARVVLVDIGGVPLIDASAAGSLVALARAVRLLGATPLLVGVSPHVARTMIASGVDLADLKTLADLEAALEHARTLL